jgi:RimJ/RimL family protein N-acetyltransferase
VIVSAPIIETPRLLLRPWRDADVESWAEMNADPSVMEYFPHAYTREQSVESAARLQWRLTENGYGWWVAEIKETGGFGGVLALQDVPFEAHFTPAKEVGWRLPVAAWGHGYATEGGRALLAYALGPLGWPEVVAMTAEINVRSQRVMQRLGMTHDPGDDFEHPHKDLPAGHRLKRHVLYRMRQAPPAA